MAHEHQHPSSTWRLAVALGIAVALFVIQLIGARLTGSLALLADTVHVAVDAAGLLIGFGAAMIARRPTSQRHTWGWQRAEVLGALFQAMVLIGVGAYIVVEALRRMWEPVEVPGGMLLWFGVFGLFGNLIAFAVLTTGSNQSLNLRAATLEVLADALGSVAVIISALLIQFAGWAGADSIAALLIGVLVMPRAFGVFREAMNVLLEATPPGLDLTEVRGHLLGVDQVRSVHDLHASRVSTSVPVLTAHVVLDESCFDNGESIAVLQQLRSCVAEHFPVSIEHSTFQLESAALACELTEAHHN